MQAVSHYFINYLEGIGAFWRFCGQTLIWTLRSLLVPRRWVLIFPQMYEVGTRSIPVIMLVGAFIGMVLSIETFDQFAAIGQESRLGVVINMSVLRQIGPVLAAVMLAGRVGGAFAAELGTMSVTEQIDAMKVMATEPVGYLVVPRVIACVIMIPALTVISDLLGIFGGWLVTVVWYGVSNVDYWANSAQFIGTWDVFVGLGKSLFFGLAIGLIACWRGFQCDRGAAGVGQATTEAFVKSFIAIIVLNFLLAKFFKDLYFVIYGTGGVSIFGA